MAITPLFTLSELDQQIAAYKQALLDLAAGKSVVFELNGARRQYEAHEIGQVRKQLVWLQNERVKLEKGRGTQFLAGRARR